MKNLLFLLVIFFAACQSGSEKKLGESKKEDVDFSEANGETLFKANCASCHKPNEKYVGPALQGATGRWQSEELLYEFVRNSQDVITRNAYAKNLYEEYKQSPMLPYPNLKDKDIKEILRYCDTHIAQ